LLHATIVDPALDGDNVLHQFSNSSFFLFNLQPARKNQEFC